MQNGQDKNGILRTKTQWVLMENQLSSSGKFSGFTTLTTLKKNAEKVKNYSKRLDFSGSRFGNEMVRWLI